MAARTPPAWAQEILERMDRLDDAIVTHVIESAPATPKAKAQVTIAERRKSDRYVCDAHGGTCGKNDDGHFATKNGAAFHATKSGGHFA